MLLVTFVGIMSLYILLATVVGVTPLGMLLITLVGVMYPLIKQTCLCFNLCYGSINFILFIMVDVLIKSQISS